MMDAGRHPNIELLTLSEVTRVDGGAGDFLITVRRHPRGVFEDLCTGCGDCAQACPVVVPNEFDLGLGARKAIYSPFSQAVPNVYVIDCQNCLNGDFIVCENCSRQCERDAIDYDMTPEDVVLQVGSIIVATGLDVFDPYLMKTYGYSLSPNILTGLEFERLLNASGPTKGHVIRPTDGKIPKKIAFVQCVGARGENDCLYCSRFCCMNSVKDAMLAKDHEPDVEEITIFYSDIRASGKGYEELYNRSRQFPYIKYFRGKPSKIIEEPGTRDLILYVEDTLTGKPERIRADLVVLASAGRPPGGTERLAKVLGIKLNSDGYFQNRGEDGQFLSSTREGIYLCGCARGPEDIPDSVAQGTGAAAEAGKHLAEDRLPEVEEEIPQISTDGPPRIGVFLCHCGINIAGVLDIDHLQEYAKNIPHVVHVQDDLFLCSDGGQKEIQKMIVEKGLNRVVAAACTPRTHEPIFRESCARVGFNPYLFEMVNVRDQCSWVHSLEPDFANQKAHDLLRMACARAQWLQPLRVKKIGMQPETLVIGGGMAGIQSTLDLKAQGFTVHLVEKEKGLGGRLRDLHRLYPEGRLARELLQEKLGQLKASGVNVLTKTEVTDVKGYVGNFEVITTKGTFKVGSIILAAGADVYRPQREYGYGKMSNVLTNLELEGILARQESEIKIKGQGVKRVAFIQCVGSRDPEKNPACSRFCCPTTVKQAIALREKGVDVAVFYRDMRMVGHGAEEMYQKVRGMGVLFIRVPDAEKPKILGKKLAQGVEAFDSMLGEKVEVEVDAVVLAAGMVPREPDMTRLQEMLKVPRSPDRFFMERHPKLGPVETTTEGIFLAGCIQGPKDLADTMAQAAAAAGKATTLVCKETIALEPTVCEVDEMLCRGCGKCVAICQFNAPELVERSPGIFVSKINEALCKGCGTCAAWCPTEAISAKHFTDRQITSMIESLFQEVA
ncbi:CoB--CoM heterodisulfide reductase iron-sulfur subunit A family protein [candidate division KSB1 bacterium]|nr:CoB--CoM heterodisulfide reductase iron-sulfur subunit A family protein [candidate division KSB1 bacterium]